MWRRVAVGVVVVAVAAAASWIATRPDARAMHADLLSDLRARGVPLTVAEAEPAIPPDARNGAHDLDLARAWWEENEPADDWSYRIAGSWNYTIRGPWWENASPEQLERLPEFLVFLAPLFEHVDRAFDQAEIAWPHRVPASAAQWVSDPVPPEIPWIQELVRLLEARSVAGATAEERCRGLRARLAIGARYRARNVLDHLIACVAFQHAVLGLRQALENEAIDPAHARNQLDSLLAEPFESRLATVVKYERLFALELVPFWLDGTMEAELAGRRAARRAKRPTRGVLERLEEWYETAFEGKGDPDAATYLRWVRELDLLYERARRTPLAIRDGLTPDVRPRNRVTSLLDRLRPKWVDADAAARIGRIALAAYAFRRVQGAWPECAADLTAYFPDGVPLDPFTGEAFVFGRDGDHLTIRAQRWSWLWRDDEEPRAPGDDWRLPPR